jgi:hypothetical protein
LAAKNNDSPSDLDKTSFFWTSKCGICHPGGGPGEFDRDGEMYYDIETGLYGYEVLGKTAAEVELDGDYALLNPATGMVGPAPWHVTGVSEPDCLFCHVSLKKVADGTNNNWVWRTATLRSGGALVDSQGAPVAAFAAASAAAQGWFSNIELAPPVPGQPPTAVTLDLDYSVGVEDEVLVSRSDGLYVNGKMLTEEPRDYACWGCHVTPDLKKRGRVWFDPDEDVHYAGFNLLTDDDPDNDIQPLDSEACTGCHEADLDHNITKGNAFVGSVQDETDYEDMKTCWRCHAEESPDRDPEAPIPSHIIHTLSPHGLFSCQACHIPYKTRPADFVVDNATTGSTIGYSSTEVLSADPLDPTNPDKSRWYPAFKFKESEDGIDRLYPAKILLSVWWGDWDQNGTPDQRSDDVVAPIALWRVRQITGNQPLPIVTDDNGDGKPEVNRPEEIAAYLTALKGSDVHGEQVATNPVLVKGGKIWYEDLEAPFGVNHFDYEGTGVLVESTHPFSLDHNVRESHEAWGAEGSCNTCHRAFNGGNDTVVFDRLILVDPFDETGQPVYEKVREMTYVDPW